MFKLIKQTFSNFLDDRAQTMAAALAYYTAFSLPPLLVLILLVLGAVMDPADLQGDIQRQLGTLMGVKGAEQVKGLLEQAQRPATGGVLPTIMGIFLLLFGATGVFGELQAALNSAWKVAPDPKSGGWKNFVKKRLLSFTMVFAVAFLLLVSLTLSAMISAFGNVVSNMMDGGLNQTVMFVFDLTLSFIIFSIVFATIFKFVPDAKIDWHDVRAGAMGTAVLFLIGKFLIGFYLGRSNPGEAYGAAGSLAILLVWLYYSSILLLLGAEFTKVWADARGRGIKPEKGAISTEKPTEKNPALQSANATLREAEAKA
ncbi:MAG: YihY/virulence factor BrkB family protein [Gemmatimonadota bacterium]